jgi:ketosteroid isomerase-like protein
VTVEETRQVMERYWSDDDLAIGDDAEYTEMATGQVHAGKDAVLELLRSWYEEKFSGATARTRSKAIGDGIAATEYVFTGTRRTDGSEVEFPFAVIYEIRDGAIRRARIYYDNATRD